MPNEFREDWKYVQSEKLDQLIDFSSNKEYEEKVFDMVGGKLSHPFPPDLSDLVRLHKLVRERHCFTVLEFGVGYSSIILADALIKNKRDWEALDNPPEIRNRFMFQLFSVDASKQWLETSESNFPKQLASVVNFTHSEVEIGTYQGQLCHYYTNLPDIVPDFIYLDGPMAKDVKGSINGLSFQCDERTVMAGDLLLMEPTFLPGTFILVDGRTNNVRFLQNNFKRNYAFNWDEKSDVSTFELIEKRLGKYNQLGADFF